MDARIKQVLQSEQKSQREIATRRAKMAALLTKSTQPPAMTNAAPQTVAANSTLIEHHQNTLQQCLRQAQSTHTELSRAVEKTAASLPQQLALQQQVEATDRQIRILESAARLATATAAQGAPPLRTRS